MHVFRLTLVARSFSLKQDVPGKTTCSHWKKNSILMCPSNLHCSMTRMEGGESRFVKDISISSYKTLFPISHNLVAILS